MGIFDSLFAHSGSTDKLGDISVAKDEYWYVCQDCEGTGSVNVPDELDESVSISAECPVCEGRCVIEGDEDDEAYGWVRVPN